MSLPNHWIDRIFEKLTLVYGQEFLNRWKGVPIDEVKMDWAHELGGLKEQPEAVTWALRHLPTERPPTVLQFREICRRAPDPERPRLSQPKADSLRVQTEIAKLRASLSASIVAANPTDWAHRILAEHEAGVLKTSTVLAMARAVATRHPRCGLSEGREGPPASGAG